MKKLFSILAIVVLFSGCNISEDCVKSSGAPKSKEIEATPFEKIIVNPGISLVIKQGDFYGIKIFSGSHFIDDIEAKISDNTLTLTDNSGCNLTRAYGQTTVYVTAPNIVEIYSNTGLPIKSDGVLTYPLLRLFAMDFFGGVGSGDFVLEVDNGQLVVESNYVSGFYISGHTDELLLNFYDGIGRFEGGNFQCESIRIFQRGSNDMIVHPLQSLTGDIYSTGNVISKTHPSMVAVIEHYQGRLLFEN